MKEPPVIGWLLDGHRRYGWNEPPNNQQFQFPIILDAVKGCIVGKGFIQSKMMPKPCDGCKPIVGAINHVPGHVFVGWGIGWQPCPTCGGSGVKND